MSRIEGTLAVAAAMLAVCAVLCPLPRLARAGVVGSPHDLSSTNSLYSASPIAAQGVCSVCHIPHAAQYGYLWPRSLAIYDNSLGMNGGGGGPSDRPNYKRTVTVQCYDCHDAHVTTYTINDAPQFSSFAANHKPQNVAFGYTVPSTGKDSGSTMKEDNPGGSEKGFYENSPPYTTSPTTYWGANSSPASPFQRGSMDNATLSRTGGHYFKYADPGSSNGVYKGDKLACSDCHDPHVWDSTNKNWHAFFRPAKLYGYPSRTSRWNTIFGSSNPIASSYMANDLLSGEASRNDGQSRRMCILCHGDSTINDSVTYNDIDSAYTSTQKITRPPVEIAEHSSGSNTACVSCHKHNSVDTACTQCHGFPPSNTAALAYPERFVPTTSVDVDSHPRHYGSFSGQPRNSYPPYSFNCDTCHAGSYGPLAAVLLRHNNDYVSVIENGVWTSLGSGFDNTNYYNQDATPPYARTGELDNGTTNTGWGTAAPLRLGGDSCRNTYCHSAGRAPASMTPNDNTDYRRPRWNSGPQHCNDCHGPGTDNNLLPNGTCNYGMPNYASGPAGTDTANSHSVHVLTAGIECYVCHAGTVTTGVGASRAILSTVPSKHVNRSREVEFGGGVSGSYLAGKRCSVAACHGADNPQWGGKLVGCSSCHLANGSDSDHYLSGTNNLYAGTAVTNIDNTEWTYSGHGRTTGNYDVSNYPAANLLQLGTGDACYYCHTWAVGHDNAANPFRLANYNWNGQGWNGNCLICHFNTPPGSPPGYQPPQDPRGVFYALTAATAAFTDNAHYGAKHGSANNGGKFCWDCHDPHGDRPSAGVNSIYMLQGGTTRGGSAVGTLVRQSDNVFGILGSAGALTTNAPSFTAVSNGTDYADNTSSPYRGICQVCHTTANHYRSDFGDGHNKGTRCTNCHQHDVNFKGLGGPDVGQYFDRSFQPPGPLNFPDNASHPLQGLTTTDNGLLFGGQGSENCLGCHYQSGPARVSDECLKCHFENQGGGATPGALDFGRHMNKIIELATVSGNSLPTTAYTINSIVDFDNWCLQCHKPGSTTTLGRRAASGKTVIDDAAFGSGRHRATYPGKPNAVGCVYCHQPHGTTNTRLVRNNPATRLAAGQTPRYFGVFPGDNLAGPNFDYRSRVDSDYADADDENRFCNTACHNVSEPKDKIVVQNDTTGRYVLLPGGKKQFYVGGFYYTLDNSNLYRDMHQHNNDGIIPIDNMVQDYAAQAGMTGPSYYHYPGLGANVSNPYLFDNAVRAASPIPFFPDFGDGVRDFTNGYNGTGWVIKYRFTCSTCHNPHGSAYSNSPGGNGYPDLRLPKRNPKDLCDQCH